MRQVAWFWYCCLLLTCFSATAAQAAKAPTLETGVSLELAKYRSANLANIHYNLRFSIPDEHSEEISARQVIEFDLKNPSEGLQLDFKEDSSLLKKLTVNGEQQHIHHEREHLLLDGKALKRGQNTVEIEFIAGEGSLNRSADYLYTLFVPDRARTAFPLFDQPDLKAFYSLELEVPGTWVAIAGGPTRKQVATGDSRKLYVFEKTDKMSSYLFSFVAGEFDIVTRTIDGRTMTLLHRESDNEKVERNLDDIFKLHSTSLQWLEDYTDIELPFKKLDFALIPAHQYGGMEHVGAIQYKAETLFLDEDASDTELLSRASLIAHEVAHMWFGNMVTMEWFNDVWTKEVFANFMAAKIVNPSFPDINHELNFLMKSYPRAYGVDRTTGANAIRQYLPNLNEAGTLYGSIIYNKAPIMMQFLELLLGEEAFQDGIQEYLRTFEHGNATWDDLITIFDARSDEDLRAWSKVWVNTPRRPDFFVEEQDSKPVLVQSDPLNLGRIWPQTFTYLDLDGDGNETKLVYSTTDKSGLLIEGSNILFNADGKGYGLYPTSMRVAQMGWNKLSELQRGSLLINLYEQLVSNHADVRPSAYVTFLYERLQGESNQLLLNLMLRHISNIYWTLLSDDERQQLQSNLEAILWQGVIASDSLPARRKLFFKTYQNIAMSDNGLEQLFNVWHSTLVPGDLKLSEADLISLAQTLAIKKPDSSEEILSIQLEKITDKDRKRRFAFVQPSLSNNIDVRDTFFASLKDIRNRSVEPWVLSAIAYLHHPLRRQHSEKYIKPSLELLQEIQKTGDIFFPARWSSETLQNHNTPSAAKIVQDFLEERPNYNAQLKLKILQAADPIFRAQRVLATQ